MAKTHATTSRHDHRKMIGEIDTVAKGEDPATMTTMTEKTPAIAKGSNQGDLENTIHRQMTC
jgi:hypothetical protein